MAAKSKVMRPWTATDVRILKGLGRAKVRHRKNLEEAKTTDPGGNDASVETWNFTQHRSQPSAKKRAATGQRYEIGK